MKKKRLVFLPLLSILLFLVVLVLVNPDRVVGQATIPTRTPVPDKPTDAPPQPTKDDDDDKQPLPTDTPQPLDTPVSSPTSIPPTALSSATRALTGSATAVSVTSTATSTSLPATATSVSQIDDIALGTTPLAFPADETPFPTAEPCGEPPTITILRITKVYEGPGSDYPVSETLRANEVRPIVGRAADATWWLVQIDENYAQAWIKDTSGNVNGFTGNVPIVDAPPIDGASPTPGEPWDPTPEPICTPTPAPTPTPSPTSDSAIISGSLIDTDSSSAEKVDGTDDIGAPADVRNQMAEAAAPLELEGPSTPTAANLLPIAGLVLVIAAIFVALFLRRTPGGDNTSS